MTPITYRDKVIPGNFYTADYLKVSMLDGSRSFDTLYSLKRYPKKTASSAGVVSLVTEYGVGYTDTSDVYLVKEKDPIDVSITDATNLIVSPHMVTELASGTTATEATVNTNTVSLVAGHGFVVGQMFVIEGYYMGEVRAVATNLITLDVPFSYTFPAGTAVKRCGEYMNLNGATTPILFLMRAVAGRKFDIEGIRITFISAFVMDDSLFASIAELTNGLFLRIKKSATQYNNVFNAISNQDLKMFGNVFYSDKAPSGKYGMTFDLSFRDLYGVVVRLDGDFGQQIELWVRDNLTGIEEIEASVMGHVVED